MPTTPGIRSALVLGLTFLSCLVLQPECGAGVSDPPNKREYAFDLWDWTAPCRDLNKFRIWAADLKKAGLTRIEISAPWTLLEPRPGEYDLSFIADRLAIAKSFGMGMRVRINTYYAGCTPGWLQCDRWQDIKGEQPFGIPSINDDRFWKSFAPLCTAIARRFTGEDILYSPFIGVHAELKWADWWTYDNSSLQLWKKSITAPRPRWLKRVVGDDPLPERPTIPAATKGNPDRSPESRAFIAFREECWREAVRRFTAAIRLGDPNAQVSVPLGESYRRESAHMSNLDYFGLSQGANQVVHSYDFFWHARQDPWYAGAAVSGFRGITGLPVSFEFDGPTLFDKFGYKELDLIHIGEEVLKAGAGFKLANYSYAERLPSDWPVIVELGKRVAAAPPANEALPKDTVLLFVSKWANYCYRESTEWLHDAQFGAWRMLVEGGIPVRVICEDNLNERLTGYKAVYAAFSPPELMPEEDQIQLQKLCSKLPSIVELPSVPPVKATNSTPQASFAPGQKGTDLTTFPIWAPGLPGVPCSLVPERGWKTLAIWNGKPFLHAKKKHLVLGYPMAYVWLKSSDRRAADAFCTWSLNQIGCKPRK